MLNTKQRAQLRALANPLAVTLIIGKEGVTEAVEREQAFSAERSIRRTSAICTRRSSRTTR